MTKATLMIEYTYVDEISVEFDETKETAKDLLNRYAEGDNPVAYRLEYDDGRIDGWNSL